MLVFGAKTAAEFPPLLMCYRAANDTNIAIHGKQELEGYTMEGSRIGIDVQIAVKKKTLGSARRMCETGNSVVFDDEESYVEHKETGERTMLTKAKGAYEQTVWVPKKGNAGVQPSHDPGRE